VKLKPRMMLVLDKHKRKRREKIINLRDQPLDDNDHPYVISSEIPNKQYGVDIREYLEKGLVLETPSTRRSPS